MPDLIINPPVVTAGTPEPELRLTELTRNGSPVSRALIVDQVISTVGAHVVGGRIPNAADGNYQAIWDATNGVNPPAQVTASAVIQPAATAPTFGPGGTIAISGADIVFTPPPVTGGFPAPTVTLSATRNGEPVTVTNNRIANGAIGGSADQVYLATWTGANGTLPNATRSATLTIPAAASAPGQFTAANWSASTGLSPFEVVLNLSALPSDGGSAITRLQYEAGFGWTDMPGLGTGPRVLSMPMAGTEYSMRVRAANTVGFGPSSTAKPVTSGAEEVVTPPDTALRAGTLTNPPMSVRLGVLDSATSRPFTNAFKQGSSWQGASNSASWASLVSGGYMTAGGQLISIAPGSNGFLTRLFFGAPAQSGLTGRHRLRWQGTCTIDINGASNVNRDVPNEISFDFTANGSSWVDVIVRTIDPAGGQIRNFSVVHADDIADFDAGRIFRTQYLDEVRNYRALRFDEWIGILRGENEGGLRITSWASRPLPTDEIFHRFVPYEWMAALCNEVGADMWLCLPTAATDDHIQQAASLIRNLMPAPRHVYVEYSTKTWDFAGTPQAHYCAEQGRIAFGTTANPTQAEFMNWYAMRSTQLAQWWRAVWGNDTRLHTVVQHQADVVGGEYDVLVAPMWRDRNGTLGLPAYVAPHSIIDMLTIHAQIDGGLAYHNNDALIENWRTTLSQTDAFNRLRDQLLDARHYVDPEWVSSNRNVANMSTKWEHYHTVATGYGMEVGIYELGSHLNGVGNSAATIAFVHAFSVSAQMGEVYAAIIDALREIGFTGPLAFAVEARYPDANISHGLQRWLGDHNPAWAAVEAINMVDDGPAGRGATDFVGTFDTTDGTVVTPPPTPSYPTLPEGMLRPGSIPIKYSGPEPVIQITADWFNGVMTQCNPDLITFNSDDSIVLNAQFMNNDKRTATLNQSIWNSGQTQVIKPRRSLGRWSWVASSTNPAAVLAMFLYDSDGAGTTGAEIDFEYGVVSNNAADNYGYPNGTRGFWITVHMPRTSGSGTRTLGAGFVPYTEQQWLTPALFEIDFNADRALWFINGTQVGSLTRDQMLTAFPDANWATTARLEPVSSVERHAAWAGWTTYTTANMKLWGIRLPTAAEQVITPTIAAIADQSMSLGEANRTVPLTVTNGATISVSPVNAGVTATLTQLTLDASVQRNATYTITVTSPTGHTAARTFPFSVTAAGQGLEPYLGIVATNLRMPTASTTSNRQFNSRSHHKARDGISALQINLPGWWWQQASGAGFTQYREHPTQGSATYRAAIEYPEGNFTQLTFGGNVAGTANAGQDMLSDSVPVSIPEGASFWVRVYMTSTWGMVYTSGDDNTPVSDQSHGERLEYAASGIVDKTMGGTIANTGTSVGRPMFSPIAIIAETTEPSVLLVGDSRVFGVRDTFDADGNKGELARGLGPHFGYINVGSPGDSLSDYLASNSRRTALAQWCSHVVVQSAINALRSGTGQNKSAATVLAEQQQILALFPGKQRLTATTMTRTGSSDSWATVANQTPIDVSARIIQYNEAIRAGVANSIGYFEIADTLETARNSGLWRAPGFTSDGLHATPTGYAATVAGVDITLVRGTAPTAPEPTPSGATQVQMAEDGFTIIEEV